MKSYGLTCKADLTWTRGHGGPSPNLDMASRKRVYSAGDRLESQKQLQFLESGVNISWEEIAKTFNKPLTRAVCSNNCAYGDSRVLPLTNPYLF